MKKENKIFKGIEQRERKINRKKLSNSHRNRKRKGKVDR